MSETVKPKPKKRKKRKLLRKEERLWNEILERDLLLNDYALSDASLHHSMVLRAFELEKKRNQRDYVR